MMLDIFSWAIGFWEGEGSVNWIQGKWPSIRAAQKEREPLERMIEAFGGKIYGPYLIRNARLDGDSYIHHWILSKKESAEWIERVSPYLSERRRQQLAAPSGRKYRKRLSDEPASSADASKTSSTLTGNA